MTPNAVVMTSGGLSSWMTGKIAAADHGTDSTTDTTPRRRRRRGRQAVTSQRVIHYPTGEDPADWWTEGGAHEGTRDDCPTCSTVSLPNDTTTSLPNDTLGCG